MDVYSGVFFYVQLFLLSFHHDSGKDSDKFGQIQGCFHTTALEECLRCIPDWSYFALLDRGTNVMI